MDAAARESGHGIKVEHAPQRPWLMTVWRTASFLESDDRAVPRLDRRNPSVFLARDEVVSVRLYPSAA